MRVSKIYVRKRGPHLIERFPLGGRQEGEERAQQHNGFFSSNEMRRDSTGADDNVDGEPRATFKRRVAAVEGRSYNLQQKKMEDKSSQRFEDAKNTSTTTASRSLPFIRM